MPGSNVYIKFPKTGLGNMLLVWGNAFVFARKNNLTLYTGRWWGVRPGAWLRRETKKRLYWNYFKEDSIAKKVRLAWLKVTSTVIDDPKELVENSGGKILYRFHACITDTDYFKNLKPFRDEIRNGLDALLTNELQQELLTYSSPVISVHIRRGDFKLGSTLTPVSYFRDAILRLREYTGELLPVTVFSDAADCEISEVLSLSFVQRAGEKADILDIILMSRSKILIPSISSTFSMWSAFLCDGIVLKHPDEWHPAIRPASINETSYEAHFNPSLPLDRRLTSQLDRLKSGIQNVKEQELVS